MIASFFLSSTELGQALLGLLVTAVGVFLHHKSNQIHLLVNGRLDEALRRIAELESELEKLTTKGEQS